MPRTTGCRQWRWSSPAAQTTWSRWCRPAGRPASRSPRGVAAPAWRATRSAPVASPTAGTPRRFGAPSICACPARHAPPTAPSASTWPPSRPNSSTTTTKAASDPAPTTPWAGSPSPPPSPAMPPAPSTPSSAAPGHFRHPSGRCGHQAPHPRLRFPAYPAQGPAGSGDRRTRGGRALRRQFHPRLRRGDRRHPHVLTGAGIPCTVEDGLCCCLTWVSTGQLTTARRTVARLDSGDDRPIIVAEPSCAAALRRDVPELLDTDAACRVAARAHTLTGALTELAPPHWGPLPLPHTVVLQTHCHEYATFPSHRPATCSADSAWAQSAKRRAAADSPELRLRSTALRHLPRRRGPRPHTTPGHHRRRLTHLRRRSCGRLQLCHPDRPPRRRTPHPRPPPRRAPRSRPEPAGVGHHARVQPRARSCETGEFLTYDRLAAAAAKRSGGRRPGLRPASCGQPRARSPALGPGAKHLESLQLPYGQAQFNSHPPPVCSVTNLRPGTRERRGEPLKSF